MNVDQKKEEIERVKLRLKNEMHRILKEIAVYEKALKKGTLVKNPKPGPQYNL